jgi:hypothetical protein
VDVGVEVGGRTLRGADEQDAGVDQDEGVFIDVDDPGLRDQPLGDLVGVVGGGQAGADVEELADARLPGQETDHAGEERP